MILFYVLCWLISYKHIVIIVIVVEFTEFILTYHNLPESDITLIHT